MIPEPQFTNHKRHEREPVRILLLEDDPQFAELLRAQLRRMPQVESRLEVVGTLAEALAKLAAERFGLLVADLNLPDSSGLATVEALSHAGEQLIVVLTGDQDPALRAGAMERGAYDFLSKDQLSAAALERLVRLAAIQANTFRSLRESEERFRSFASLSADVYWEQDEHYRFASFIASDPAQPGVEPARSTRIGKRRWDVEYINMAAEDWSQHIAVLEARQPFRDLELCRLVDGKKKWISTSGSPVFDAAGVFKGYRGIARDITERKREEEILRLEHAVTRCLAEADSATSAMREVMRAVCETEGWECGRYFRVDEKAGVLRFAGAWGIADPQIELYITRSRGVTYAKGQGMTGKVWQSGEPQWVSERGAHAGVAQSVFGKARDAFLVPLRSGAEICGMLNFTSRALRPPDERLLQAVRVIGSQVGQFLLRKRGEEAVRESEARFRSLTQLSSDWYWEQDENFRFVEITGRNTLDGGGGAPHRYRGKTRWETGLEIVGATWEEHRAVLEAHKPFRDLLFRRRHPDGEIHYTAVSGEPVFDEEGTFKGYRGVGKDMTEALRREEELRRFRLAMDNSADIIVLIDRSTMRFIDVNATACRLLGYSRGELLAMGPQDLLRASREDLERAYDSLLGDSSGDNVTNEHYRCKDGSLLPFESTRRVLRSGDTWIIAAISRDLTERRRATERQALHMRYQERIARFGQSALRRRESGELIGDAVQNLLEGLAADAVAYFERGPGANSLVLRALVGAADSGADSRMVACRPDDPILRVLQSSSRVLADGAELQLPWARDLRSAALVPVHGERGAHGVVCVFCKQADAFAAEGLKFIEAAASVLSAGLQRIDSEGKLAFLAQYDPLTGLPNRALLADRFSQMIVQARRRSSPLGVLFVDLDEFKMVNDTLGHAGGDALLKEAAVRLQSCVRPGDTVARISGDEFAVVLGDLARPEDAALVAQKIIDRLAAAVEIRGQEVFVTASIGIAAYPGDGSDAETLIGAADAAMYRAKQSGRNAYQFFTAEINQRSRARAQIGSELRGALEREEFALVYQPKFDLAHRTLKGAEALLRWSHPERGMVLPAEFIPVLEETGLIVPVGEWVLRRACEDIKAWQAAGLDVGPIAVNLSARQFRQQDLDARIKSLVGAAGIDPAMIELEITESQLMQDPEHAIRIMRSLCESGMRIAIDDFGTGYSSLSYLTRFPIASLKIDRSFVANVNDNATDAAIVRAIIEMARALGFTVVAEGIETEAQAEYLRRHGCEQAQGYLFARPMPAADLAKLLSSGRRRPATASPV